MDNNDLNDDPATTPQRLTYKDTRNTCPTRDFDSAPDGTGLLRGAVVGLTLKEAKAIARELGDKDRSNPENAFAMFSPEEIERWAEAWHYKTEATGGLIDGQKIVNHSSALHSYLLQWAINKGRKRPEMKEYPLAGEEDDIPF
jgi:hypothetical protein